MQSGERTLAACWFRHSAETNFAATAWIDGVRRRQVRDGRMPSPARLEPRAPQAVSGRRIRCLNSVAARIGCPRLANSMQAMELLPPAETMYQALLKRDASFEGIFFVGVRTTGIFCRPTCPAKKPTRENVDFFPT